MPKRDELSLSLILMPIWLLLLAGIRGYYHDPNFGAFEDEVPFIDVVIAYDCPYTLKTYVLICANALHIPSMSTTKNLIPAPAPAPAPAAPQHQHY